MTARRTFLLTLLALFSTTFLYASQATAHVVVTPKTAEPASFEVFTVNVPNEKTVATTSIKLVVPAGVTHITPTQKPGWKITTEQNKDKVVTAVIWSGEIAPERRDEFTFSAQLPETEQELHWKAHQTYANGVIVSWDQTEESDTHATTQDRGPLSVTNVKFSSVPPADNPNTLAIAIAVAAFIISFIAVIGVGLKNQRTR